MTGTITISDKLILANYLKALPDEKFYMDGWFDFNSDSGKLAMLNIPGVGCISAACVAGWAWGIWPDMVNKMGTPDTYLIAEKLGLDHEQATELFYDYDQTRLEKIALLEKWARQEA